MLLSNTVIAGNEGIAAKGTKSAKKISRKDAKVRPIRNGHWKEKMRDR